MKADVVSSLLLLVVLAPARGDVVRVEVGKPTELRAGGKAEARIKVTIKEGFHVQANPASERYLIPLELLVRDDPRVSASAPAYPPGKPHRLAGAESDLSTYDGAIEIGVPLTASRDSAPSDVLLQGSLRYQACDARSCLPPASVPFSLSVRVLRGARSPIQPRQIERVRHVGPPDPF